jgi:hypothetical protein
MVRLFELPLTRYHTPAVRHGQVCSHFSNRKFAFLSETDIIALDIYALKPSGQNGNLPKDPKFYITESNGTTNIVRAIKNVPGTGLY